MGDLYNQWMLNDPRYLEMMRKRAAMGVPDYQLNTPSLSPSNFQNLDTSGTGILDSTKTMPAGRDWMDYTGLGISAAAPVAAMLLGKTPPKQEYAPGSSLGQKGMMQFQYPYGQMPKLTPSMLAQLLMAGR